jgi:hypothetical protein
MASLRRPDGSVLSDRSNRALGQVLHLDESTLDRSFEANRGLSARGIIVRRLGGIASLRPD